MQPQLTSLCSFTRYAFRNLTKTNTTTITTEQHRGNKNNSNNNNYNGPSRTTLTSCTVCCLSLWLYFSVSVSVSALCFSVLCFCFSCCMRNACGSYVGLAANLSKPGPSRGMRDRGARASDCRAFVITITHSEESKRCREKD